MEPAGRTKSFGWALLAAVGAAAALAILYFFAPTQYPFYPRCIFHATTGLSCPGCGSLRAMHSLLHGNVAAALQFNPLLFLLLPVVAGASLSRFYGAVTGRELFTAFKRPVWIWLLLGVILIFSVGRNLPFGPLAQFRL